MPRTLHPPRELVLGTTNAGKVRELALLLEPHGIRVLSLRDCGGGATIEETGSTFAENAALLVLFLSGMVRKTSRTR